MLLDKENLHEEILKLDGGKNKNLSFSWNYSNTPWCVRLRVILMGTEPIGVLEYYRKNSMASLQKPSTFFFFF